MEQDDIFKKVLLYQSHLIDLAHLAMRLGDELDTHLLLALQCGGWDLVGLVLPLRAAPLAGVVDRGDEGVIDIEVVFAGTPLVLTPVADADAEVGAALRLHQVAE